MWARGAARAVLEDAATDPSPGVAPGSSGARTGRSAPIVRPSLGEQSDIVKRLLDVSLFHPAWVLWLLLALSLGSIAVMVERAFFFRKRRIDVDAVRRDLRAELGKRDYVAAVKLLEAYDSLETNVVLFGLREHAAGPDAVE